MKILSLLSFIFCINAALCEEFYHNYFDGNNYVSQKEYDSITSGLSSSLVNESLTSLLSKEKYPTTKSFVEHFEKEIGESCLGLRREKKCIRNKLENVIGVLRFEDKIDNQFYLIVQDYISNNEAVLPDLKNYLLTLHSVFNLRKINLPETYDHKYNMSFLNTRRMSRRAASYSGLYPRQVLYYTYNSFQIKALSSIFEKTLKIMNSSNAYIHIDLANDEESEDFLHIDLSYTEKYRLAVKLLSQEVAKLPLTGGFPNRPLFIDVLMAAVETGVISKDVMEVMIFRDDFTDSYRNRFKIYGEIAKRLGLTALTYTPVIGQLALIPIILLETRQQIKDQKRRDSDETHLF